MNTITKLLQARRVLARYVRTRKYHPNKYSGLCMLLHRTQQLPANGQLPDNYDNFIYYVSNCVKTWPVRLGDPEGRTLEYPIRRGTDTVPRYANPERLDLAKHIIKCIDEDIAKRRAKRDLHVTLKQIKAGKYDLRYGICAALCAALDCKPYYSKVFVLRDAVIAEWLAEPNIQHPKEATLAYPVAGVGAFLHETDDEARTNPRRLALLDYMIEKTKP